MKRLVTISARVSEELKRKADELGINISAVVRRALEEEVRRAELEGAVKALEEEVGRAPELPKGEVVRIIREARSGRLGG